MLASVTLTEKKIVSSRKKTSFSLWLNIGFKMQELFSCIDLLISNYGCHCMVYITAFGHIYLAAENQFESSKMQANNAHYFMY